MPICELSNSPSNFHSIEMCLYWILYRSYGAIAVFLRLVTSGRTSPQGSLWVPHMKRVRGVIIGSFSHLCCLCFLIIICTNISLIDDTLPALLRKKAPTDHISEGMVWWLEIQIIVVM